MADFTIGGFHHTCVYTPLEKMDSVKDFYVDFLGFDVESDTYIEKYATRMIFLTKGEFRLEIVNGEENHEPGTIDHLCFYCTHIEKVAEKLREMGFEVREPIDSIRDGVKKATMQFFVGPVGEQIELYEVF